MFLNVAVLKNHFDEKVENQWVEFGVPVPHGKLYETGNGFGLFDCKTNKAINSKVSVNAKWPDGSVQWLFVKTLVDIEPNQQLELSVGDIRDGCSSSIKSKKNGKMVEIGLDFVLVDHSGHQHAIAEKIGWDRESDWSVEDQEYVLNLPSGKTLNLNLRLHNAFGKMLKVETRLHNPHRAIHQGGCWDLGDEGSLAFESFGVELNFRDCNEGTLYVSNKNEKVHAYKAPVAIHQMGSGGPNWFSPTHQDKDGHIPLLQNGYIIHGNGECIEEGLRAHPLLYVWGKSRRVCLAVEDFWQNFPASISLDEDGRIYIGHFPKSASGLYELQGGEAKTHTFFIDLDAREHALKWVREPVIPVINQSMVQDFVFTKHLFSKYDHPFDPIVSVALDDHEGFFAKAEKIDEFGWRNFGDLYADHETHYQDPAARAFVSHYNNQYDPILGFAMQYLRTGDRRWFVLMSNLAKHVVDIDIYQTSEDRVEYNNGLFWHTDHYLDAHTSTHRTFSKHNNTSSTPGQTGGGPGTEHCYASGLAWFYYLTGNERSRSAVLGLAHWMISLHEGGEGCLSKLVVMKKFDVRRLKSLTARASTRLYRLPFTRGTGNYLNVMLDAFFVTQRRSWIFRAESIIRDSLHYQDRIEERGLSNIEETWSYVILLQSIRRYLQIKEALADLDDAYWFARRSLMHYVSWMVDNEEVYLTRSEQLEFPNHTWVAQEARKFWLLSSTIEYSGDNAAKQHAKATYFLNYLVSTLRNSPERAYTRVLVILLQNYGWSSQLEVASPNSSAITPEVTGHKIVYPRPLGRVGVLFSVFKRLLTALGSFSLAAEKRWLQRR